jgi:hypothetical protein
VPHGSWTTVTFLAALRHDRVLVPTLRPGDIVKEHKRNERNGRNKRNEKAPGSDSGFVVAWVLRKSAQGRPG